MDENPEIENNYEEVDKTQNAKNEDRSRKLKKPFS